MENKQKAVEAVAVIPKFLNGSYLRDKVTGLEGIVIATTIWMNGCVRYVIQPQETKDGKPVETTCLDEQQLDCIDVFTRGPVQRGTGGGRDDRAAISRST